MYFCSVFPWLAALGHVVGGSLLPISVPSACKAVRMVFPRFRGSHFDLHFHTAGKLELHQRVDGLRGRAVNIQQSLVRAQLKLLPGFLIHVRRTQHSEYLLMRWQRNRSGNHGSGRFDRLYDLLGRLVYQVVIV